MPARPHPETALGFEGGDAKLVAQTKVDCCSKPTNRQWFASLIIIWRALGFCAEFLSLSRCTLGRNYQQKCVGVADKQLRLLAISLKLLGQRVQLIKRKLSKQLLDERNMGPRYNIALATAVLQVKSSKSFTTLVYIYTYTAAVTTFTCLPPKILGLFIANDGNSHCNIYHQHFFLSLCFLKSVQIMLNSYTIILFNLKINFIIQLLEVCPLLLSQKELANKIQSWAGLKKYILLVLKFI